MKSRNRVDDAVENKLPFGAQFRSYFLHELRSLVTKRPIVAYVVIFSIIGSSMASIGALGLGYVGFRAFTGATSWIINLTVYVVPLVALLLSSLAIVSERERGSMEVLLSMPLSRSEILIGKTLSSLSTVLLATSLGLGITGWFMWNVLSDVDAWIYASVLAYSIPLTSSYISIGTLVSVLTRSRFAALGAAIGIWMFTVIFYELFVAILVLSLRPAIDVVAYLLALNPAHGVRLLMIRSVDPTLSFMGEAGTYLTRDIGHWFWFSIPIFLTLWSVIPLAISSIAFSRQDL